MLLSGANLFKKSNLAQGKIQNYIFYQQVMFQLIWLFKAVFIIFIDKNCMFLCHRAPQGH